MDALLGNGQLAFHGAFTQRRQVGVVHGVVAGVEALADQLDSLPLGHVPMLAWELAVFAVAGRVIGDVGHGGRREMLELGDQERCDRYEDAALPADLLDGAPTVGVLRQARIVPGDVEGANARGDDQAAVQRADDGLDRDGLGAAVEQAQQVLLETPVVDLVVHPEFRLKWDSRLGKRDRYARGVQGGRGRNGSGKLEKASPRQPHSGMSRSRHQVGRAKAAVWTAAL